MRLGLDRPRGEDPDNDGRQARAINEMAAFDLFGPIARAAIRESRFDAEASHVQRRYGGPFADDDAVARRVKADDDKHSGCFGPAYPKGI